MTPQLSKVMERLIGSLFLPFLEVTCAYGPNQFAYTRNRGLRDALALNVIQWLLAINKGYRVGLYCSDVSGAFDRVSRARLLEKLKAKGIHPKVLRLLESWLDTRTAEVIVDGCASDPMVLDNSVFQGTVWGPPLWNVFYEDSRVPIQSQHFIETVFADDLNCFRSFPASCSDALIFECMRCCQESLHEWGCANQVLFDPSKESFHILHDVHSVGDCFHQLGFIDKCLGL